MTITINDLYMAFPFLTYSFDSLFKVLDFLLEYPQSFFHLKRCHSCPEEDKSGLFSQLRYGCLFLWHNDPPIQGVTDYIKECLAS